MVTHNLNNNFLYIFLLTLLCYGESKRDHGTGSHRGGHTTPRSDHSTTHNYQQPTEGNIGFERYQPSQNNRQDIGFENVDNRVPPNTQPHGGSPQYQTHNPVGNSPSAPLPPMNHNTNPQQPPGSGIGFENVHQRVPPNQQPNYSNNQQPNYPHAQQPNNTYNGYNNHQPQYSGSQPGQYTYQPPPTYYNPQYSTPGGVPPPIYQPEQQSSGSSILGYAGTFAGGYLIGRLTSGSGGGGDSGGNSNTGGSGDNQYTVYHYYHDANSLPKQMSVWTNSLVMCDKNNTQGLCVPNTFAICLSNGTIMCVTHSMYATPCGGGNNLACVITVLPCVNKDTSCNATGNLTTTAVYIPCISNVTVSQQNLVTSDTSNQNVQYCVTAIAEPKKLESPIADYVNFLQELARLTYQMSIANSTSTTSPVITSNDERNKTEMTTLLPFLVNGENKTEVTTLPYYKM